jgi:hypothetical protein
MIWTWQEILGYAVLLVAALATAKVATAPTGCLPDGAAYATATSEGD